MDVAQELVQLLIKSNWVPRIAINLDPAKSLMSMQDLRDLQELGAEVTIHRLTPSQFNSWWSLTFKTWVLYSKVSQSCSCSPTWGT